MLAAAGRFSVVEVIIGVFLREIKMKPGQKRAAEQRQ